ncbi:MAG: permease [Oscillospiraceae bacterium]|nr:permease [Oscillospiraceae bacterium]
MLTFIKEVLFSALSMLNSASPWMVFSFAIAGALHDFVGADTLSRSSIGSTKITGLLLTTLTGMCIPICSCGTIPLGISMYFAGAYLGPTLTFMTSSPMINPIAIILAFGLLGPQIAIVYIITGFFGPMIIGLVANKFAGDELYYKPAYEAKPGGGIKLEMEKPPFLRRIVIGLRWSFSELSLTISKYTVSGMLIAGLLFTVIPQTAIQRYLGDPGLISLLGITIVAALMYVCAIGHIPFIAALVASGASPGVAITFLMAGCATNIAELLTISRTIGRRAVIMYSVMVIALSEIAGYVTNRIFPNFKPVLDYDSVTHSISTANAFIIEFPEWLQYTCSFVLIGYAAVALFRWVREKLGS